MTDLVEFLGARLDEDEQAAREAGGAPWEASIPNVIHVNASAQRENRAFRRQGYVASTESGEHQRHIALHDPARVLLEVEANREIIDEVTSWRHRVNQEDCWYTCGAATEERDGGECCNDDEIGECSCGLEERQRRILAPLARAYADHPEFIET